MLSFSTPYFAIGSGVPVPCHQKGAKRRSVITLLAAENLITGRLSDLDLILARQFQRGLDRFRSPAGEVDGAAAEAFSGERQQFFGVLFGDRGGELAGVNELE